MQNRPISVECVGRDSKNDPGNVFLPAYLNEAQKSGRLPEAENEQPGSRRIEGPCVTDLLLMNDPADLCNDVVRCPPCRFVNGQEPIDHKLALIAAMMASGGPGCEKPAALWCPPPCLLYTSPS